MLIKSVIFKEDFRCYKKGEKISFNDKLTVISGDNGSGKSTLVSAIRCLYKVKWSMSHDQRAEGKIDIKASNFTDGKLAYLDLSQDLYKTSSEINFDDFETYREAISSSSGEGSFLQILKLIQKNAKDSDLLILDEPERGLSIKIQKKLFDVINHINKSYPDLQIIIITHSELLMSLRTELFSTSHKSYISNSEYLSWMLES